MSSVGQGARAAAVGLCTLLLGGCGSVYLYDAQQETATAAAKDNFSKLTFAEIQDQQDYLAALAASEAATVKAFMLADRDRRIATFIKPAAPVALQHDGSLRDEIDGRLTEILGMTSTDDAVLKAWATLPEADRDHRFAVMDLQKAFDDTRELYVASYVKSAGGSKQPPDLICPAFLQEEPPRFGDTVIYKALVSACTALDGEQTKPPELNLRYSRDRLYGRAIGALSILKADQAKQAAANIEIDGEIMKALSGEKGSPGSADLSSAVADLREKLGRISDAAQIVGANRLSDELQQVLRAQLASAAGAAPAADPAAAPPSDTTTRAQVALDLVSAFVGAGDVASGQAAGLHIDSILVALAGLRQRQDMARLQIERDQHQMQIRQGQISALIRELALLARARLAAEEAPATAKGAPARSGGLIAAWKDKQAAAAAAALAAYSESWAEGRIPYHLGEFQSIEVDRSWSVAQAAKTAANWKALLAPTIDQLAADGAGGIKPETIAQTLANIGIISAISAR